MSISFETTNALHLLRITKAAKCLTPFRGGVNSSWAEADEIYVPKIGLADGLIKMLYNERKGM